MIKRPQYAIQMQATYAVELMSTVMGLRSDTPAGRKAVERDEGCMRAKALVLKGL
jgi:hypothetical protein